MADNKPSLDALYAGGTADSKPSLDELYAGQKKSDLSLLDVPGRALSNLGPSAKRFAESMVQPFIHPIETAKNIGRVGMGYASKIAPGSLTNQEYGPYADAVNKFFVDRYGGWENIKRTMADDPVGFAADIATVATGGETALARVPGVVGKVGEVSGQVAKYTNPLNVTKAVGAVPKLASEVAGVATGKGAETYRGLARSGFEGGQAARAAERNLRQPDANADAIVQKARGAYAQMYAERSAAYQKNLLQTNASQALLDFNDIDAAINKSHAIQQFQGRDVSAIAGGKPLPVDIVKNDIENAVANWKRQSAAQPGLRTAGGFDALKQYIGKIKDSQKYGTPEWKAASDIYNSIRDTIAKQEPSYAKAMKEYQEGSDLLDEIGKTLSLKKKASDDTALRKLLSATRSDVNTNFGRRLSLAEQLNKRDPSLLPSLYGQSAAPWAAGGLMRGATGLAGLYELMQQSGLSPGGIAKILGIGAATSPRVAGEAALASGKIARRAKQATPQEIIDLANKVNPDVLRQLGLGSRVIGGANAPQ